MALLLLLQTWQIIPKPLNWLIQRPQALLQATRIRIDSHELDIGLLGRHCMMA